MSNPAAHGGRTLSRDYKHVRRHAQGTQAPGFNGWVGLGIGLGVGLTFALAVHLHYKNQIAAELEPVPVAAQAPASATATDEPELPSASGSAPQDFDFYDMLPKQEVDVPNSRQSLEEGHADRLPTGDVVLQAGSFKQATEAEKMVAQLALAGVESKVQRASVQDETWYRVRIGPIATVQELYAVRMKLDAADIDAPPVMPAGEPALP